MKNAAKVVAFVSDMALYVAGYQAAKGNDVAWLLGLALYLFAGVASVAMERLSE